MRRAYLASIVPVIINAVLSEHQVVVDIVAFVAKGDFPRSRLGEKQRGKILASWVTRKMETIAQFSIRDADAADSQITEVAEPRSTVGSVRIGSSLKNVEPAPREVPVQQQPYSTGTREVTAPLPYESSILESPPLPLSEERTSAHPANAELHLPSPDQPTYSQGMLATTTSSSSSFPDPSPHQQHYAYHDDNDPSDNSDLETPLPSHPSTTTGFDFSTEPPPAPRYESKPSLSSPQDQPTSGGDLWTLPSQQPVRSQREYVGGGRLRVANANAGDGDEDQSWPQEAIMHMNLGGAGPRGGGGGARYDGSGYGGAL